jgi:hypothetical protein
MFLRLGEMDASVYVNDIECLIRVKVISRLDQGDIKFRNVLLSAYGGQLRLFTCLRPSESASYAAHMSANQV